MKLRSMIVGGVLAAASIAIATPAHAALITGTANFALGDVLVSPGEIDFNPPLNPGFNATKTYGQFVLGLLNTGVFSAPDLQFSFGGGGAIHQIQDMSSNPLDANFVPLNNSITPNFLQFANRPTWQFTEAFLQQGQTLLGQPSPFFVEEGIGGTSVTMNLTGLAFDTTTPTLVSAWRLVVSAQYNESFAQLQQILAQTGQLPNNTWSATLTAAAVPEPATLLTFGLGSMYLARRRRNQKKS